MGLLMGGLARALLQLHRAQVLASLQLYLKTERSSSDDMALSLGWNTPILTLLFQAFCTYTPGYFARNVRFSGRNMLVRCVPLLVPIPMELFYFLIFDFV